MKTKVSWMKNPTKKQTIAVATTALVCTALLVVAMTNLFSESLLQGKYFMLYLLIIFSAALTIRTVSSYFKNR
jgi:hypothetical protein